MDEAGRSAEPPLTMAPPRREGATEADGGVSAAPSGIMAPPPKVTAGKADAGKPAEREEVPFPADDIGQSQAPADAKDAKDAAAKTELADEKAAKGTSMREADAAGEADAAAGEAGNAAAQDTGEEVAPARSGNGASKLEGGLQTVKQAVAATNNWLASRVTKAESGVTGTGGGGSQRRAEAEGRDGTASAIGSRGAARPFAGSAVSAGPVAAAGSAAQSRDTSDGTADQPLQWADPPPQWRDPYPSSSGPSSAARTAPVTPEAPGPGPLGSGSLGPGSGRGKRPASRGWTARPSGQPGSGASAKRRKASARRNRRQAHLTVARVEPWSVMKFSFVVSVVAFIVLFVAIAILYAVLSSIGVFESLQRVVTSVTSSQSSSGANVTKWFSASRVLGYTGLLGSLNIVLITAMSTIGAVIYNLISRVFGGVEITLRETE